MIESNPYRSKSAAEDFANYRRLNPILLGRLAENISPGEMFLDAGCGRGRFLEPLSELRGGRGVGIEISPTMLAEARKHNQHLVQGDIVHLPFADGVFPFVYSIDVIHFLKGQNVTAIGQSELSSFFQETARVLAPGGSLFLRTDRADKDIGTKLHHIYFPETVAVDRERFHSEALLRRSLLRAGFLDISVETIEAIEEGDNFRKRVEDISKKAQSALRLISDVDFEQGLARLNAARDSGLDFWSSTYSVITAKRN